MIDIIVGMPGEDLGVYDTQVEKAKNILSVQLGALEYIPDFGIDLKFFLDEEFKFQNESFKSYLIVTLANNLINVASLIEIVEPLISDYIFTLTPPETSTGLIAR